METFPPSRKRKSPVSSTEREYYIEKYPEKAEDINSGKFFEEESDIPAHYKLEKKIINDLLEERDLESEYKFVESKRGIAFANELREKFENEDKDVSYKLKRGSIMPIMKKFLSYVDELNSIYQKYSPCKKGCSLCCDIPVAISDLEAIIIKEYLDKNHIKYHKLSPMGEKQKNAGKNRSIGDKYYGVKCLFLKDDNCSIYSARPFVCRKYIVIGVCNMEQKNRIVDVGYIIGKTYDWIIAYHIRKNLEKYASILDPLQIKVTQEADLNGVYNLSAWQKFSDIRDNFSDICFN
jgi:Fe-S-cluster containining protein